MTKSQLFVIGVGMAARGLVRCYITGPAMEAGAIDYSATLAELGAPDERDLIELRSPRR